MKPRILFLDDEEAVRKVLAAYFGQKGYELVPAVTAIEAMALADKEHFDLAIMDINLAGENGLELLRYFKRNFPKLPVVMFTGLGEGDELMEQAMHRGANGFMRKGESLDNLFSAVQAYLPKT